MPGHLRARAAAARLPPRPFAVQLVPSGRSVAVSLALALLALLAYLGARETAVFAVRSIEVQGVRGAVARRVETALIPLEGKSLLKVNGSEVTRLATALPYVAGVTYDRAFPNTLRVRVEIEQPLAVVRRGVEAWLVSRRGRVTERIAQGTHRKLPRIWLPQTVDVSLGATLATGAGADEVAMLAPLREARLARRVASVHRADGQWVYMLRGGLELRAGTRSDLPLKLAIARRILARTPVYGYLDVSAPDRPVAGLDSQVSG
jgi:cell division septal protein FtsQ